jgi:hypothetical protein
VESQENPGNLECLRKSPAKSEFFCKMIIPGNADFWILSKKICQKLDLRPTMFFYVVKDKDNNLYSIGKVLGKIKQ